MRQFRIGINENIYHTREAISILIMDNITTDVGRNILINGVAQIVGPIQIPTRYTPSMRGGWVIRKSGYEGL